MGQQPSEKNKKTYSKFVVGISIVILLLIIAAVAVATVAFFIKSSREKSEFGDYIAVFSILITMIAVILPLSTYFINKDEVKKLTEEFNHTKEKLKSDYDRRDANFNTQIANLDYRYVEIFEGLVQRKNISYGNLQDTKDIIFIDYINALNLFQDGAYNACRRQLDETVYKLGEWQTFETDSELTAVLLFKIFNLYRKLAGRTRTYEGDWRGVLQRIIMRCNWQKSHITYRVAVYMYVRIGLDEVEKAFADKDEAFFEELLCLTETIKSDLLYYYALKAKYYYVLAYFAQKDKCKRQDNYIKAYRYAELSYKEAISKSEETYGNELSLLLSRDSKFTVTKVLEKISFGLEPENRKNALEYASELVESLIVSVKTDPKYYLELSEILKKQKKTNDSDYAAQYGFQLAPTDPLLAAQCAYIYLRDFLRSEAENKCYLVNAEECIETAYWIYRRERNVNHTKKVNVRFSYIASLYSVIKTYVYIQTQKVLTQETKKELYKEICTSMHDAIKDNLNNVPNYKRALIVCLLLYVNEEAKRQEIAKKVYELTKDYCKNEAFVFSKEEEFYGFSEAMKKIHEDVSENTNTLQASLLHKIEKSVTPFADNI